MEARGKRNNLSLFFAMVLIAVTLNSAVTLGTVVDFEDLTVEYDDPLPADYAGLDWDTFDEEDPIWWSCGLESAQPAISEPHSGDIYIFNRAGVTNLGFSLPNPDVDYLLGAWFTKTNEYTPDSVRFIGRDAIGDIVQSSDWLMLLDTPLYLEVDFSPCARIEIERSGTEPAWYTMDDLTYVPEPATVALLGLGSLCLVHRKRR